MHSSSHDHLLVFGSGAPQWRECKPFKRKVTLGLLTDAGFQGVEIPRNEAATIGLTIEGNPQPPLSPSSSLG